MACTASPRTGTFAAAAVQPLGCMRPGQTQLVASKESLKDLLLEQGIRSFDKGPSLALGWQTHSYPFLARSSWVESRDFVSRQQALPVGIEAVERSLEPSWPGWERMEDW